MNIFSDWPNRTACDILEDMRNADKSKNFSYLRGLIEEMQAVASRMEAGLYDKGDVKDWRKKRSELKREIRKLESKKLKLERKVEEHGEGKA